LKEKKQMSKTVPKTKTIGEERPHQWERQLRRWKGTRTSNLERNGGGEKRAKNMGVEAHEEPAIF